MVKRITLVLFFCVTCFAGFSQNVAAKLNLLYGATQTPNIGLEIGLGKKTSLDVLAGYNPFNRNTDEKKLVHSLVQPEFRYWLCERFSGHFFGIHGTYSSFNISQYKIPALFEKDYRYEGFAIGGGLGYGYHWVWSKYWAMEFNIGFGYLFMEYDKYRCERCAQPEQKYVNKHYVGPTKAGISLIFVL